MSDINQTLLHAAAGGGHTAVIELILKYTEIDINAQSETGKTALFMAVEGVFADSCVTLLKAKADVRKETARAKIPIYVAAETNKAEIVKILLPYTKQVRDSGPYTYVCWVAF